VSLLGGFMRLRVLTVAITILLAFATPAGADDISVGGKILSIAPPQGSCAYDRSNDADAAVMKRVEDAQAGRNSVVLQFGLCDEFVRWRANEIVFTQFGQIMLPLTYTGAPCPLPMSRQAYLDQVAPKIPQIDANTVQKVEDELNSKVDDAQISDFQILGILDRDENALYVGFVGVLEIDGKRFPSAGVGAITMLGSVPAIVNLDGPAGEGVFDKLLDAQKAYVAELIRKNP
jgi:hypothetical protein